MLSFVRKHPSVRVVIPFLKIPSGPKFPSHRVKLQIPTIYLRPVLSSMTTIHVWLLQFNSQFVSHASHISTLQQPHVASSIRCTGIATRYLSGGTGIAIPMTTENLHGTVLPRTGSLTILNFSMDALLRRHSRRSCDLIHSSSADITPKRLGNSVTD